MKPRIEAREEPIEQLLAGLDYCLADIGDQLPSIAAKMQDIHHSCCAACCIMGKLKHQLVTPKHRD